MKTNKILASFIAFAALTTGCIKETFPTDIATTEQIGASSSALAAMVSAMPAQLVQGYLVYGEQDWEFDMAYPGIMIILDSVAGEIIDAGDTGYDWYSYWSSNEYTLGEKTARSYVPWRTFYIFVKSANDVIAAINPETANEEQLQYLGQAKAYRAFSYLNMARMYEYKAATSNKVKDTYKPENKIDGMTVPYVSESITQDEAKKNPRIDVNELYTKIFADLDDAEKYLENYSSSSTLLPSLAVVYGLQARAYLERGSAGVAGAFAKAAEYAKKAMDAFGGSPLTQDQWENPKTGFNNAAANSNSWMWNLSYSAETMGNLCNFNNHMSPECTWSSYSWAAMRGVNKSLYNSIPDTDFRKHSWLDPNGSTYYAYKTNRDIYSGKYKMNPYTSLKFRPASGDYATYKVGGASEVPLMRVEEMYLIRAEALAMAGDVAAGQAVLNELVKTRDASYDCTSITDAALFQDEVYRQKRIELWGEGLIYFDAKRLGKGIHTGYKNTNAQEGYTYDVDGVCPTWNFVIPQSEIEGNPVLSGYNNPDPSKTMEAWKEQ